MQIGRLAAISLAVLAAAACGGETESGAALPEETVRNPVTVAAPVRRCVAGSVESLGSERAAFAAVVRNRATVYRAPGARPFATFGKENVNRFPTVFGVRAAAVDRRCKPRWYRVQLPMRPNGAEGWVRAADVDVAPVHTRIYIDLSERRVTLFRRGRPVLRAKAAIGSSATPTPVGRYYVNQRLVPRDTSGPFGPGAIGISAFSNVLTGWTQGGPIAIHGTNRPDSIGRAVSNGCIRVENRALLRLFEATPAGTPVIIRA